MPKIVALIQVALFVTLGAMSVAAADCVTGLANCSMECDQRTKPGNPDRPQCAQSCISNYPRCVRAEEMRSSTGGGLLNNGKTLAPSQ